MSCENEAIGPGENLLYTLPSQTVSHKLGKSAISRQQSTTAVSHGKSWKPPVAPKPSLLKSCRTETVPMTVTPDPGHQQSVNNEAGQRSEKDTHNGLLCGPQMQQPKQVMHSPRVPVFPVPHPSVQTSPASPPELPPRQGSITYPDNHHRTHTITENEKQPPLPPKPRRLSNHSHSKNLKVLPVESERSLTLMELADSYSKSFPIQVKIVQGFYGKTNKETFYDNETFNILCPKHEEVLVIRDENQHHYSVPLSSAIQFSLLYTPDGMKHEEAIRGQTFKKVANIVELETPPKVICATKSCLGVYRNEVFVILGVHKQRMKEKKGLDVFSLVTHSKKTLPHDCTGYFSTESSLIQMYPADIRASLHYLKQSIFPCNAKLCFGSEVADQLQSLPMPEHLAGVITVCELNTRRSLVAYQVFSEDYDGEDSPIFDIPLDENLSDIEIIVADHDLKNEFREVQLTSSTVSVLKSVSSNPSKLQPWEPKQSDTTKTLLRKTVRRGYENVGIRLEVNPQLAHSANLHELMEADAAIDMRDGYDTITFDNVHSEASGTDADSPSHESNGYVSDCPQPPPRTSSWSRSRSLTHKAMPKQLTTEDYTPPVQSRSPIEGYDNNVSPLTPSKEKRTMVPLRAPPPVGVYTPPLPNTSKEEHEYAMCTTDKPESDCTSPEPFPETSKSHLSKRELLVDPQLQQMQEQIQSLQKQVFSLMVRKRDDFSRIATENVHQQTNPTPASEDCKLKNSDLKYIMQTLCDLSAWYLLGVYLDVPKGKLDQFHATYGGGPDAVERCKIETICYWLENARKPTWATLAAAVLTMGRRGIAEKIFNRCGVALPICQDGEKCETLPDILPQQVTEIEPLQKQMEMKDQEFFLVEQNQIRLEEQLQNLQKELSNVRDWLQFNERLTRKLISDGQRIKSDLTRATMGHESSHVNNHFLAMHHKRDRISSLRKEHQQSKSKLEEAQNERKELIKKLHELESKISMVCQRLHQLQSQEQLARAALQQQERVINESLVSSTQHQYYNIVIHDGKVEMKLTQQQVETLHRKIADENLKVKQLHEQLEFHQQKLQKVTRQNELLDMKGQTAAELEKHQRAYLESTLEADVMQCRIEISTTEFHKQQMESRIHWLKSHMKNLKRMQGKYEQIEFQIISSQRGKRTDLSHRPRSYSASQIPPRYRKSLPHEDHNYYKEIDSPSSTRPHVELQQKCCTHGNSKLQGGIHKDLPHFSQTQRHQSSSAPQRFSAMRPRSSSASQSSSTLGKTLLNKGCYHHEQAKSPGSTKSHVNLCHGNCSTHSAKPRVVLAYRAMPLPEQHQTFNPTSSPKKPTIPPPHASLYQDRLLHESHHKLHQSFPPYFSNPPYKTVSRSAPEEYDGQPNEEYVTDRFDDMGEVSVGNEDASIDDSVLNNVIYEPMASYMPYEYSNFSQEAEDCLPINDYDSDDYEEIVECYTEPDFIQPTDHDLAYQLSHPPKPSKNKPMVQNGQT